MIIAAIPARLKSTRLSNKLIRDNTGHPLIWHTVQQVLTAKHPSLVFVLADDQAIADALAPYTTDKFKVILTGHAESGTERIAKFCRIMKVEDSHIVVNFQGDEPELDGKYIDKLVDHLYFDVDVATLAAPATDLDAISNSVVKVVVDDNSRAMYFSRSAIPYGGPWLKHMGIYCYRAGFLKKAFPTQRYGNERLEQLSWLCGGAKINVLVDNIDAVGVDTMEEYLAFVERYLNDGKRFPERMG